MLALWFSIKSLQIISKESPAHYPSVFLTELKAWTDSDFIVYWLWSPRTRMSLRDYGIQPYNLRRGKLRFREGKSLAQLRVTQLINDSQDYKGSFLDSQSSVLNTILSLMFSTANNFCIVMHLLCLFLCCGVDSHCIPTVIQERGSALDFIHLCPILIRLGFSSCISYFVKYTFFSKHIDRIDK